MTREGETQQREVISRLSPGTPSVCVHLALDMWRKYYPADLIVWDIDPETREIRIKREKRA